jgi:hypothetical protein
MQRVKEILDILPKPKQSIEDEVVKVQEPAKVCQLIEQLELPKLCDQERLDIASCASCQAKSTGIHHLRKQKR